MIKLIENVREALNAATHAVPVKEKIQYLNRLMEIGYFAVDIGKYDSNENNEIEEIIFSIDKKDTQILIFADTEENYYRAIKNPGIDLVEIPFSLLNKLEEVSSEKTIIDFPIDFGVAHIFDDIQFQDSLKYCKRTGIQKINFYNNTGDIMENSIGILFRNCISHYPEIEFGSRFYSEEKKYRLIFDLTYSSGCRLFETSINGWAKNETGTITPTEKIVTYLTSVKEKNGINTLVLESAYNIAKKIFSGF
ncbi:MAG: hypothetical protein LBP34_01040 [Flavobacteriaceae bacterium]|jgi:hydroxymethylglutaryl-CoA lyase|nr:hypothetical protein [Flavobacteriaceae bacterium]